MTCHTISRHAFDALPKMNRAVLLLLSEEGKVQIIEKDDEPDQSDRSGPETLITQCQGR